MSTQDFNNLTHLDKTRVIISKAIPLMKYTEHESQTILYSLNAHFVEVIINPRNEEVEKITIVRGNELDKYIRNIKFVFNAP